VIIRPARGLAQDRESSPVKDHAAFYHCATPPTTTHPCNNYVFRAFIFTDRMNIGRKKERHSSAVRTYSKKKFKIHTYIVAWDREA